MDNGLKKCPCPIKLMSRWQDLGQPISLILLKELYSDVIEIKCIYENHTKLFYISFIFSSFLYTHRALLNVTEKNIITKNATATSANPRRHVRNH